MEKNINLMRKCLIKVCLCAMMFSLLILGPIAWSNYCGTWSVTTNGICFILTLLSLIAALICFPLAFVKKIRRKCVLTAVFSTTFGTVAIVLFVLVANAKGNRFDDFAHRSENLVNAIKKYDSDHGYPPESLKDLVPRYLPKVPDTGMWIFPEYEYSRLDKADDLDLIWYDLGPINGKPMESILCSKEGNLNHTLLVLLASNEGTIEKMFIDRMPHDASSMKFNADLWKEDPHVRISMVKDFYRKYERISLEQIKDKLGAPDYHRPMDKLLWNLSVDCTCGDYRYAYMIYRPIEKYCEYLLPGDDVIRYGDWYYIYVNK